MPKNPDELYYNEDLELLELEDELNEAEDRDEAEAFGDDLSPEDYGFIIGPNGSLKSIYLPDNCETLPKHILAILKACGIKDAEEIYTSKPTHTLH